MFSYTFKASDMINDQDTGRGYGELSDLHFNKNSLAINRSGCVTDSPLCRACMEADETPTLVMLKCTGVTEQREIYLGSPATIPEVLSNLGGMLGFWNELGWLE
ncbi:jg16592 [Pararge aegeria aegeria]|uniref:Jg16592 protein n=1 Tax=Pararge aegeria aegeria TaxID=348720 RepID=A0A8S4RD61_9NEOP|nr:jg16592 [Pararge aegeria aegeria]